LALSSCLQYAFNIDAAAKAVSITIGKARFMDEGKYTIQLLKEDGSVNMEAVFNIYVKGE